MTTCFRVKAIEGDAIYHRAPLKVLLRRRAQQHATASKLLEACLESGDASIRTLSVTEGSYINRRLTLCEP